MDAYTDPVAFSAPHKLPPTHSPQIPPKLGIRKRKPRSTTPLTASSTSPARLPYPAPPARVPTLSPSTDPLPEPPQLPTPAAAPPSPPPPPPPLPTSEHKRKGLRHFAIRVTRKVEQKNVTTYNEVADELVAEERALRANAPLIDEKNIRRRVYDSLNVLMAMNIISKSKKQITWQGLHCARDPNPRTASEQDLPNLLTALEERRAIVERKRDQLATARDVLTRMAAVIDRNRDAMRARDDLFATSNFFADFNSAVASSPSFDQQHQPHLQHYMSPPHQPLYDPPADRLSFPFYVVSAKKDTKIELEVSPMRDEVRFTFDSSYEIFDNHAILSRIPISPLFTLPQSEP